MACVELAIKLKTGGAPLAPRATHPPGNEASVHPAGAFPMCGGQPIRRAAGAAERAHTRCETFAAMALAIALAAHYFRCHDFFL